METIGKILIVLSVIACINLILYIYSDLDEKRNEIYQNCVSQETIDGELVLICE